MHRTRCRSKIREMYYESAPTSTCHIAYFDSAYDALSKERVEIKSDPGPGPRVLAG